MTMRALLLFSSLLLALMLGLSLWAWPHLSADVMVAVHWNAEGTPDRYAHKARALLEVPAAALGLIALFAVWPAIEPRRFNLAASATLYRAAWIGTLLIMGVSHAVIVVSALGIPLTVGKVMLPATALLLIVIGNFLSKSRSNFFAGVRTPWTLSSDYAWERTHRLASRLMMAVGVIVLVLAFAVPLRTATLSLPILLIPTMVFSIVMSYVYWRQDPTRHAADMTPDS